MPSAAERKAEAHKMQREVLSIERSAVRFIGRYLTKVSRSVRGKYRSGRVSPIVFPPELSDVFSNLLLLQHLRGRRRIHIQAKVIQPSISLSSFHRDELNKLQKLLQLSDSTYEQLKDEFDTQALRTFASVNREFNNEIVPFVNKLIDQNVIARDGINALDKKLSSMGFVPKNPYTIENLFRTQSQIAYNAGKYQAEQNPIIQEIMWGYEYVTVGDDRVRTEHAALNGTRLPKDDPFWTTFYPPNGWSCRCAAIPIFEESAPVDPPPDVQPDRGFAFNPGEVLNTNISVSAPVQPTTTVVVPSQPKPKPKAIVDVLPDRPRGTQLTEEEKVNTGDLTKSKITVRAGFRKVGINATAVGKTTTVISPKKARQIASDIDHMREKYPGLKKFMTDKNPVTLKFNPTGGVLPGKKVPIGILGQYNERPFSKARSEHKAEIAIRNNLAGNKTKLKTGKSSRGIPWSVDGGTGTQHVFRHEYGHHFHREGLSPVDRRDWELVYQGMTKKERMQVSRYAATNRYELFAESFCAMTSPDYEKGMLPEKVESLMEKFLGD